jgi:hypothetical protein
MRWVLLRGDPENVTIRPLDEKGTRAEIIVGWQSRRPVGPGSALHSNRVDVGVFAHNGRHASAPAFVSVFLRDDELRTYDADGRLTEVMYGWSTPVIGEFQTAAYRDKRRDIMDWGKLLNLLRQEEDSFPGGLLRAHMKPHEIRKALAAYDEHVAPVAAKLRENDYPEQNLKLQKLNLAKRKATAALNKAKAQDAKKRTDATRAAVAKADGELRKMGAEQKALRMKTNELRISRRKLEKAYAAAMAVRREGLGGSIQSILERSLNEILRDATLYPTHHAAIGERLEPREKKLVEREYGALAKLGIFAGDRPGAPLKEKPTPGEINEVHWFNATLMRFGIFPGIVHVPRVSNYVDPRLGTWRNWRDVYHYDAKGRATGWTRHHGDKRIDFTAHGHAVATRDNLGRALTATKVYYSRGTLPRGRFPSKIPIEYKVSDTTVTYTYASEDDRIGTPR